MTKPTEKPKGQPVARPIQQSAQRVLVPNNGINNGQQN